MDKKYGKGKFLYYKAVHQWDLKSCRVVVTQGIAK